MEVWGVHMANSCICFQCDNEALVYVLNKQSSKESNYVYDSQACSIGLAV